MQTYNENLELKEILEGLIGVVGIYVVIGLFNVFCNKNLGLE
jgi:hypothetical protein